MISTKAPCSTSCNARRWPMKPAPPMSAMGRPRRFSTTSRLLQRPGQCLQHARDVALVYVRADGNCDRRGADALGDGERAVFVAVPLAVVRRRRQRLRVVDADAEPALFERLDEPLPLVGRDSR